MVQTLKRGGPDPSSKQKNAHESKGLCFNSFHQSFRTGKRVYADILPSCALGLDISFLVRIYKGDLSAGELPLENYELS